MLFCTCKPSNITFSKVLAQQTPQQSRLAQQQNQILATIHELHE